jgi:hypothetical protein
MPRINHLLFGKTVSITLLIDRIKPKLGDIFSVDARQVLLLRILLKQVVSELVVELG